MEYESIKKIFTAISASGFIGFSYKLLVKYLKKRKDESKLKADDRVLFLKLVDEVQVIKIDINGIKTKMGRLEEVQRNRLNAQGLAFWESDHKGLASYISPGLQMMLGQPDQKIAGNGWVNLICEIDKERIFKAWKFSVENLTVFDEVYSFNTASGVIKVHGLAFHNKDDDDNYTGSFGQLKIYEQ